MVAKDKSEALFTYVQVMNGANRHSRRIRLQGLACEKRYRLEETGEIFYGDTLMRAGLHIHNMWGDFQSKLLYLTAVEG